MSLLLPVTSYRGLSSWAQHQMRRPRSSEPGTDLYVPIGTHLTAPADGTIYGSGNDIAPATGRWVGIEFDNGMSYRSMHHSRNRITSGRVKAGDVYAFSGASGYGEEDWSWNVAETGGAHVHVTLWPTHVQRFGYDANGMPYTIDFMQHVAGTAGSESGTFDPEEDDMAVLITVSHPVSDTSNDQIYWSVDLQGRTKARVKNGTELDWRRALGIPEYVNQAPAVLDGYVEIGT